MSITISDLLAEIGNDHVVFQLLSASLDGNQKLIGRGGKQLRISFVTDSDNLNLSDLALGKPLRRDAIICWVESAEMNAAMDRLREREKSDGHRVGLRGGEAPQ